MPDVEAGTDTLEAVDLHLRLRRSGGQSVYAVVAKRGLGGATYELTKDYDSAHEAVQALASFLRVATVDHEGR